MPRFLISRASISNITEGTIVRWHYNRQLCRGFTERDIQDYPTNELVAAMKEWISKDGPA